MKNPDDDVSDLTAETLQSESRSSSKSASALVPCLTIVCHAELERIGERSLLTKLLVRHPFLLARDSGSFAHPGEGKSQTLADPYLSREPIRLSVGQSPGAVRIDALTPRIQIDGVATSSKVIELAKERLERGVFMRLSPRTALLLHTTRNRSSPSIPGIFGESDLVRELRARVASAALRDAHTMILGETGTGKELVARALHELGPRSHGPFVAFNMATLSESTASSVLFGHCRGAFTGAARSHRGVFERAHGGTIFLDEIGDTPESVQPMLLRVLETGRVTPLGAESERAVDVRVVTATDRNIEAEVEAARFRRPLLHRLSGQTLRAPTLRERRDDIPRLLIRFLREALESNGHADLQQAALLLDPELVRKLLEYEFFGNVRELVNVANEMADSWLAEGKVLLPESMRRQSVTTPTKEPSREAPARRRVNDGELYQALRDNDFEPDRAAKVLGIASGTMHFFIRKSNRVRRAQDIDDAELSEALERCSGDFEKAARLLEVSVRALRMTAKRRGIGPETS